MNTTDAITYWSLLLLNCNGCDKFERIFCVSRFDDVVFIFFFFNLTENKSDNRKCYKMFVVKCYREGRERERKEKKMICVRVS